jgi:daunorubicin C-13 ketoreductase
VGDFTGNVVVVTGGNSGIGLAAAHEFARRGARVALVGRDAARLSTAVDTVRAVARPDAEPAGFRADFAILAEVRALATALADAYPKIDVLCNNAGGAFRQRSTTVDGYELTIQANHLAPFLLTTLLRDRLSGGRVVNTASDAHKRNNLDPDDLVGSAGNYSSWRAYAASKASNILFAAEAARRWPEVFSVSFHPGVVRSNFGTGAATKFFYKFAPFLVTPEKAGELLVWLATTPAAELTDGGYYEGHKLTAPGGKAGDPATAKRLWEASAKAVGLERTR